MAHKHVFPALLLGMVLPIACSEGTSPETAPGVPQGRPTVPAGVWRSALNGPHPRLLGPAGYLEKLAADKPELYKEVKAQERLLLAARIVQAVEGLPPETQDRHIQRALSTVRRGITNVHQDTWLAMERVAQTFDAFHDAIAPEDRQKMIEWLNGHLGVYVDDENAFHNSTMTKIHCYLEIAYATWGEVTFHPSATDCTYSGGRWPE
ncbi:MAG: hypothetical protein ACE15C_20980, partial [Phycisphaerae bacterium]